MPADPLPTSAGSLPVAADKDAATILVVDDDSAMRMLFERYLTAFGYRPVLAVDGAEALGIARVTPEIRLIILDLVMPGVSGRELLEQLTALLPDTGVIFCSGHPESSLGRMGIDIKGAQFMQKPCRGVELQERVRASLATR